MPVFLSRCPPLFSLFVCLFCLFYLEQEERYQNTVSLTTNLEHERIYFFSNSFSWNFSVIVSFQQHIEKCQALFSLKFTLLVVFLFFSEHFLRCSFGNSRIDHLAKKIRILQRRKSTMYDTGIKRT